MLLKEPKIKTGNQGRSDNERSTQETRTEYGEKILAD